MIRRVTSLVALAVVALSAAPAAAEVKLPAVFGDHMVLQQNVPVTVWGWADPVTGREYAIVGAQRGTAFVDVTVPESPVWVGFLPCWQCNWPILANSRRIWSVSSVMVPTVEREFLMGLL